MLKKIIISASCIITLAGCGNTTIETNSNVENTAGTANVNATSTSTSNSDTMKYSAEMVASHNTTSDCWAIINGKVYDLTKWEDQHPGGKEAILRNCGKDLSSLSGSHAGGDFGSADLQRVLVQFYKGDLE